jgi:STE24 endopeptidase
MTMTATARLMILALCLSPTLAVAADFDPVAATDAFLATVPADVRARADAYTEGGHWLMLGWFLYGAIAKWLLLRLGWSARMRDAAFKIGRYRFPAHFLYGIFYVLAMAVLVLPMQISADFWRDHYYGMSTATIGEWARGVKGGVIQELVFVPILAAAIFGALAASPRRWWIYGAGIGTAIYAVQFIIFPLYIAPLNFTVTPIEAGPARDQILSLARANQIPVTQIFRFDLSKVTSFPNANVKGIGPTARITVSDNLLDHGTLPEIRLVVAHEMGHYVMGHAFLTLVGYGFMTFALFGLLAWAYPWIVAKWGPAWGIRDQRDIAAMPALMTLILLYRLVVDPVDNYISRTHETQADLFGINASRDVDALPLLVMKAAERDKLAPGPIEEFLFFDHPSARTRILAAMRWKAENLPNGPASTPGVP